MAFDINISDNVAKLALSGDIDLQVSGDIKAEIERLTDLNRLEIDASEVSYIDSSGVAVLILARQFCAQNNMTLALPAISAAVHRVLQIAKLDVMLPIGEVVSAPEPEEFSFDSGDDAFGAGTAGDGDFGGDDDLVNSLLSEDDLGDGPTDMGLADMGLADDGLATDTGDDALADEELANSVLADDTIGDGGASTGDFDGLDVNAVDFSEPAAAPSTDSADEDPAPLPGSDALKPGTFS